MLVLFPLSIKIYFYFYFFNIFLFLCIAIYRLQATAFLMLAVGKAIAFKNIAELERKCRQRMHNSIKIQILSLCQPLSGGTQSDPWAVRPF
jgi:hypothetical protein